MMLTNILSNKYETQDPDYIKKILKEKQQNNNWTNNINNNILQIDPPNKHTHKHKA